MARTPAQLADQAIGLFLEYRYTRCLPEIDARQAAVLEIARGTVVTDPERSGE